MRKLLTILALAAATLAAPVAQAQEAWPPKTVTIVVPFTAGGTTDMFARIFGQSMQQKTGSAFVVENKAGAGGNIGTAAVAKAPKDGSTLLVGTVSTHAINPFLYKNIAHDTEKDFQPVSLFGDDLEAAGAHAVAAGATLAEFQPQDDVRVYLDPVGHPFCLYVGS